MTNMNQRDRIARALANTDVSGPEDFDTADEMERSMYDRMALAALNSAHVYAIHAPNTPSALTSVFGVRAPFTITTAGDGYRVWGEPARDDDPLHMVIGTDEPEAVRDIARMLALFAVPFDVTRYSDWADEDESGEPAYTEDALGLPLHLSWADWTTPINI